MNRSESIKELAQALSKVQGQMRGAAKESINPFYHSKYADLASCWDACRAPLADNGLCVIQDASADHYKMTVTVETELIHSSGEWVKSSITSPAFETVTPKTGEPYTRFDPQTMGKVVTYLRRYSLSAMVGIAPEDEDDDGNSARQGAAKPAQKAQSVDYATQCLPLLKQSMLRGSEALEETWGAMNKDARAALADQIPFLKADALEMDAWHANLAEIKDNVAEALNAEVIPAFWNVPKDHPLRSQMWGVIAAFAKQNGCKLVGKVFVKVQETGDAFEG